MKKTLKKIVLTLLPEKFLRMLKKKHYVKMLRDMPDDQELDFPMIKQFIEEGDCVLDIGANIGVFTKFMSAIVGDSGQVYSFEPIPQTYDILKHNVENLSLKNVKLFNCALSDEDTTVKMEVPLYDQGGENYYESRIVKKDDKNVLRTIDVQCRRIDSIYEKFKRIIKFIKCDVEGNELSTLNGALELSKEMKPVWFIEVSTNPDDSKTQAAALFSLLEGEGYQSYWFNGKVFKKRTKGDKSINYFFLTQKHVKGLSKDKCQKQNISLKV